MESAKENVGFIILLTRVLINGCQIENKNESQVF